MSYIMGRNDFFRIKDLNNNNNNTNTYRCGRIHDICTCVCVRM